jgi:fermentation-respiration switch protein FrsA (DUF1100 family)
LQSDYRVIWRSVTQPIARRFRAKSAAAVPPPENDNASPLFPPAFFNMLGSGRPMLLVFGGSDRLHWEFEEKFVARYREKLAASPRTYEVHTIEHANHVLSFGEWEQEMLDVSTRWIHRHFPKDVAAHEPLHARQTAGARTVPSLTLPSTLESGLQK